MDSLGAPWKIDGSFDADTTVEISTADDWVIGEFAPVTDEWTPEEIARVYAMQAAPELLRACTAILEWHRMGIFQARAAIERATPPDFTSASTTRDRQEGKR
jgi:hypothetical protein